MRAAATTGLALLALVWSAATALEAQQTPTSACLACHGDGDLFEDEDLALVELFPRDVHAQVGLSCHDCHGGNPDPGLGDDMDATMDRAFAENPYRGAPSRGEVPEFCGRCHSDPTYMRRFRPDIRVDQEQEYWTSHHGQALKRGDENVANCVDCHGVHAMLRPRDPGSPVYPTRVAETCGSCHSDRDRMAGYTLRHGRPLPVDQYALWRESVHAKALLDREDLSAPTCNDCHGNHGATPPGLDSIAFVCGQCHRREAELFRASKKRQALELHNEFLAEAGEEGCAECHEDSEPAAHVEGIEAFSECATCHRHHGVIRPTVAMLSPLPDTPCEFCHGGEIFAVAEIETVQRRFEATREAFLDEAERQGLEGEARFDWLVDRALALPFHRQGVEGDELRELRPEFERLFSKFRIGKTHFTYRDPTTGEEVSAAVVRCNHCHAEEPFLADDATGLDLAHNILHRTQTLTTQTARAERILLAARRGGVETRAALLEIDRAVDAQIELEVLLHGFATETPNPLSDKQAEGLEHARQALEAGQSALDELTVRRRGLALFLFFVVLVLVALALKIRQLSG